MSFHRCPQCQTDTLAPTGAYWCCTNCSTAITSQALAALMGNSHTRRIQYHPYPRSLHSFQKISSSFAI